MTMPRLPEILGVTAAGLTAIGDTPVWVALAFVLPGLLTAVTRSIGDILAGVSRFRTEAMRRRHEDRLLGTVTDTGMALGHLERVRHESPLGTAATDAESPEPASGDPPLEPPP
jgi:hypothetical protein